MAALERCPNMNHGRMNAPIRFCPTCGVVVNNKASLGRCDDSKHDKRRKDRNCFCGDCGKKLR